VNIHTSGYPAGEIRSQVKEGTTTGNITNYAVAISGLNVMPPNLSPATGSFIGTFDNTTNVLSFTIMFNGLTAPVSAAHIHGPAAAGTNGPVVIMFPAFPTGVTSGVYINSFTLTPTQKNYLLAGLLYVNIHNSQYPGGEMRGQLVEGTLTGGNCAASIPTLSQWGLIILCLLLLGTGMVYIVRRQNSYVS
jgi:hypothetical protein